MSDSPPVPPTELVNGVVVSKGDNDTLEAAKLRFEGEIRALYGQGVVTMTNLWTDSAKAAGVPT